MEQEAEIKYNNGIHQFGFLIGFTHSFGIHQEDRASLFQAIIFQSNNPLGFWQNYKWMGDRNSKRTEATTKLLTV